jgi:nitric oxide synthase oxygenase domain/subunit
MRLDVKFILFFLTVTYWYAMTVLFDSVVTGGVVGALSLFIGWYLGTYVGDKHNDD